MKQLNQKGIVIWLLGLSGSGKSTVATLLEQKLNHSGFFTMCLDGDVVRSGLNEDLSFTARDRKENTRRVAELSKLLVQKEIITICSFITPLQAYRDRNREILGDRYFEVYMDCPVSVCEQRDVKGLYLKARNNEIKHFTGISAGFEIPVTPDLVLYTAQQSAEESAELLYRRISGLIA